MKKITADLQTYLNSMYAEPNNKQIISQALDKYPLETLTASGFLGQTIRLDINNLSIIFEKYPELLAETKIKNTPMGDIRNKILFVAKKTNFSETTKIVYDSRRKKAIEDYRQTPYVKPKSTSERKLDLYKKLLPNYKYLDSSELPMDTFLTRVYLLNPKHIDSRCNFFLMSKVLNEIRVNAQNQIKINEKLCNMNKQEQIKFFKNNKDLEESIVEGWIKMYFYTIPNEFITHALIANPKYIKRLQYEVGNKTEKQDLINRIVKNLGYTK